MTNFFDFINTLLVDAQRGTRSKSGKQLHHAHPSRIPVSVLNGCKKELVVIPGTDHVAQTREGKPIFATRKGGQRYQVMDQRGITREAWKKLVADEKRRAAGRFVGPFGFPSKAAC